MVPLTIVQLSPKAQTSERRSSTICADVELSDHHCDDDLLLLVDKTYVSAELGEFVSQNYLICEHFSKSVTWRIRHFALCKWMIPSQMVCCISLEGYLSVKAQSRHIGRLTLFDLLDLKYLMHLFSLHYLCDY